MPKTNLKNRIKHNNDESEATIIKEHNYVKTNKIFANTNNGSTYLEDYKIYIIHT